MAVNMRPGTPCSLRVKLAFDSAQSVVIQPHVSQHLCGDPVVGIETLKFFLDVNALHVQGLHFGGNFGCNAARDPRKIPALVEPVAIWSSRVSLSSGSVWTIGASVRAAVF